MTSRLVGREAESAAIATVLEAVRDGLSGVLVLRGEAGIGKTALLDWAAGQAVDIRVERVAGTEPEMGLAFAGLHLLLADQAGMLFAVRTVEGEQETVLAGLPELTLRGLPEYAARELLTAASGGPVDA